MAWRCGSTSEVIEHGRSGFLVSSMAEAEIAALGAATLDRAEVRAAFEQRFTAERMACDYVDIYERLAGNGPAVQFGKRLMLAQTA